MTQDQVFNKASNDFINTKLRLKYFNDMIATYGLGGKIEYKDKKIFIRSKEGKKQILNGVLKTLSEISPIDRKYDYERALYNLYMELMPSFKVMACPIKLLESFSGGYESSLIIDKLFWDIRKYLKATKAELLREKIKNLKKEIKQIKEVLTPPVVAGQLAGQVAGQLAGQAVALSFEGQAIEELNHNITTITPAGFSQSWDLEYAQGDLNQAVAKLKLYKEALKHYEE